MNTTTMRALEAIGTNDERATVEWDDGVPYCGNVRCAFYDGKRCRANGYQPDSICEPVVGMMAREIERLQASKGDA